MSRFWGPIIAALILGAAILAGAFIRAQKPTTAGMAMGGMEGMGGMAMGGMEGMKMPMAMTPVTTEKAKRAPIEATVTYTGTVTPLYEEVVYPRYEGWVRWIGIDEGSKVKAGQLIVRLDDAEVSAKAQAARGAWEKAQAGVTAAAHSLEAKRREREKDLGMLAEAKADLKEAEQMLAERQGMLAEANAKKNEAGGMLREATAMQTKSQAAIEQARADLARAQAAKQAAEAELRDKQAMRQRAQAAVQAAQAEVKQMESQVVQAKADNAQKQADFEYWKVEWQRAQALYDKGAISQEERDMERAKYQTAEQMVQQTEAMIREAEAGVTKAQAEVQQMQADVRQAEAAIESARQMIRQAEAEIASNQAMVSQTEAESQGAEAKVGTAGAGVDMAQAGITQAEAGVRQAEAKVSAAQARVNQAQSQVHQDDAMVLEAEADYRMAQAEARQMEQEYRAMATMQGYTQIRAQTSGTVSRRLVDPGTLVSPGTPLANIATLNAVRVWVNVAEKDLPSIKPGTQVYIHSPLREGKLLKAEVSTVFPQETKQTRTGLVEIVMDNPQNQLKLNSYVVSDLVTQKSAWALSIPREAVQYVNSEPVVYTPDGMYFKVRKVKLGIIGKERVEIAEGLSEGEEVIVQGANVLQPGQMIEVVQPTEEKLVPPLAPAAGKATATTGQPAKPVEEVLPPGQPAQPAPKMEHGMH